MRGSDGYDDTVRDVEVIIVGTGFSGLGLATQLKRRGRDDFLVLERAGDVGGTWRDNTYPGAACDQPSHMYSFSFRLNPEWSSIFSAQQEIHAYLRATASDEGILPHIRFGTELLEAEWDAVRRRWIAHTSRGDYSGRYLVSAAGLLSEPKLPDIPGLSRFRGDLFHSARWDHETALDGKRVGVVGTGASGVQIVPELAKVAAHLDVFQRSAHWVTPRGVHEYTEIEKGVFRKDPESLQRLRTQMFWENEERFAARAAVPALLDKLRAVALGLLEQQVPDPELRRKLTPTFEIGCKRILKSSDYYPALTRDNVDLVVEGIDHVDESGIVTRDGAHHDLDALVLATGFEATDLPIAKRIRGIDGLLLSERWAGGAEAYNTTSVSGFPNFFVLGGPNTGIGHNSQVYMFEAQIEHVLGCWDYAHAYDVEVVEVRSEAEDLFREGLDRRSASTVWFTGGCDSWYIDPRNGRLTTLWPDYSHMFQEEIAPFDPSAYVFSSARAHERA